MAPGQHDTPTPDERAFADLRALIVGEEQARIEQLEARSQVPPPRELARSLPEAVMHASRRDDKLSDALASTIESGLETSARKNPKVLAEAIYPILGPAIRRSIQATLAAAIESFNTTLEHSLSPRSLRWRLEAWRTGKSFAEVVLLKSVLYRVEQVFLIHRESGLLLADVALPAAGSAHPDLVSGMLSAIQSFVVDSFSEGEEDQELRQIEVSGRRLALVQGPHAVLAAVVRGTPPPELDARLQEALELIHLERAEDLLQFDGDTLPFELSRGALEGCLVERLRDEPATVKRVNPMRYVVAAAGIVLVGFAAIWAVRRFESGRAFEHVRAALVGEPGIVILDVERDGFGYRVHGLRDPLAREPEELVGANRLRQSGVVFEWEPYSSLDPGLAYPRALALLAPSASTQLVLEDGVLFARGAADPRWAERAALLAATLPGIVRYDDTQLERQENSE